MMRLRRGITLLETLIFGVIGLGLLGVTWGVLSTSVRVGGGTEAKISAVEATLMASSILQRDLSQVLESDSRKPQISVGIARTTLSIPVVGATRDEVLTVTYEFDKIEGTLTRGRGSEPRRVLPGRYEAFLVRATGGAGVEAAAVVYSLVGRGHGKVDDKDALRVGRSVLIGGAPREAAAARQAYPAWNPVSS